MSWFRRQRPAPSEPPVTDPLALVRAYHAASTHHQHRYAFGPGELDWDTQPDPFRRYIGAPSVELELVEPTDEPRYEPAFCAGEVTPAPLSARSIAQLFFDSLALSAAKRWGESRWYLRCNPSSGNLHPTEGWLISAGVEGLCDTAFVAHYAPRAHALEIRARISAEAWSELARGLGPGAVLVALSTIHWREAWKYGERAFRYCQHDVGHALGALAVAAAGLGWRAHVLDEVGADEVGALLGVSEQRGPFAEAPEVLVAIGPAPADGSPWRPRAPRVEALRAASTSPRVGLPNELSSGWVDWPAIDAIHAVTRKPRTERVHELGASPRLNSSAPEREPIALRRIVRSRRSAVAFDGRTGTTADALWQALARTTPREGAVLHDLAPFDPTVDLAVFVHRVQGLESGLYLHLRDPRRLERWRASSALARDATRVEEAGELSVWRLRSGDMRAHARAVSCHQEIAADGCFALAMLAEFDGPLEARGAWMYPRLFWECGWIGQMLYLEAEALGLRATGIGCFFDDALHALLGLGDTRFRSLYHFTVGGPVDDSRITSETPYAVRPGGHT